MMRSSVPRGSILRSRAVPLLVALWWCAAGTTHAATHYQVSGPLSPGDSVYDFAMTADGTWITYRAGNDTATALLSRRADGSGSALTLAPAGGFSGVYRVSPDSQRIVYLGDPELDGSFDLYSRRIDGSDTAVKLNGTLVSGGYIDAYSFRISADGSRVVYLAAQDTAGVVELYSRNIDGGGAPVKLNGTLGGGSVGRFAISPNAGRVVYTALEDTTCGGQLCTRNIDGSGTPVALNHPLVSGEAVGIFVISPDSTWVVYDAAKSAPADPDGIVELYSRPIDGSGNAVKLNGTLVSGGDVQYDFAISPDSSRVVYRADQDADNVVEIYSRPIDGSGVPVKLNGPLVSGGDVGPLLTGSDWILGPPNFLITADATRVVYYADADTDNVWELYSRPIDGSGTVVKLNAPLVSGGSVDTFNFLITPDSSRVVYRADQDTAGVYELYSRPVDGSGTATKLNGPLVSGGNVAGASFSYGFAITPDSDRVIFMADADLDERLELYTRPLDGSGAATKLNAPLANGGTLTPYLQTFPYGVGFLIGPDAGRVVYRADQSGAGVPELWATASACGDLTIDLGEQCDDGNTLNGDCCSSTCQMEPSGSPCTDHDACTTGDTCVNGTCAGSAVICDDGNLCTQDSCNPSSGCVFDPTPRTGCVGAAATKVALSRTTDPTRSKLTWKWSRGGATALSDLGTPDTTTTYSLCVYDPSGLLMSASAPAGGTCNGRACWKATPRGFKYKNRAGSTSGVTKMGLQTGADGKAAMSVSGKGQALALPASLQLVEPLTVQLVNSLNSCWTSTFTAPASISEATRFSDHEP